MEKKLIILAAALSFQLFAAKRIVLFKSITEGTGQPAEEQEELQKANAKNVSDLLAVIGGETRGNRPVIDLWLVQGAVADLTNEQVKEVEKLPNVEAVFDDQRLTMEPPNEKLEVATTIQGLGLDPGSIWGLDNIGVYRIRQDYPQITGKGVRVGILDTGIEAKHPQFSGWSYDPEKEDWVWVTKSVVFRDFVARLERPYDDHGHGTHVAGTIAGKNVGIATNADLVVGKILHSEGYGMWSWILEGMQWMVDPDGNLQTADAPKLVSNSWGGIMKYENGAADLSLIRPLYRAVRQWRRFGIIPVFANGNSGSDQAGFPHTTIPGGFAEVLGVGAYDSSSNIAYFSTRGPAVWKTSNDVITVFKPDVSAPGVKVGSAFIGGQYATWSGTSMATPHVAGALALLFQIRPKATFQETKQLLLSSVKPKMDFSFGYGILDAHKLVTIAQ